MDKNTVKHYPKGEISVVWQPGLCIHAAACVKALPNVYFPKEKPWMRLENASVEELKAQIATCPSGALSWINGEEENATAKKANIQPPTSEIHIIPNGPLLVTGTVQITQKDGSVQTKEGKTTFCRCGASTNKPFCDGSHKKIGFQD